MAKGVAVRTVGSKEERNAGRGQFLTLKKTGDQFMGFALFKPDPELADNPGYFEYWEHYTPATGYMPCIGDDCPLCEEGDNPSTRAKTLWLVVDKDGDPSEGEVKVFTLNYSMINEFADLLEDDETILGQLFRIKRLEGKGVYGIRPKNTKLKAGELKSALKDIPDLPKIAQKQAARVLEELDVGSAMDDDDDDDDKKETKAKSSKSKADKSKGKKATDDEPEEQEFDPDEESEIDGLTVTVKKVTKKDNKAVVTIGDAEFEVYGTSDEDGDPLLDVTEWSKGDEVVISAEKDDDDDFVLTAIGDDEAEEESEDEPEEDEGDADEFKGKKYDGEAEVVSVNSDEETLTVSTPKGTFELYFTDEGEDENGNDWEEFDVDDFSEGDKITVSAARDEDGDMLADAFPEKAEKKGKAKGGGKAKAKSRK